MKILVLGNINSGKSHCIEKITKIFPKYQVIKIDDYRIRYGDGTIAKENYTVQQFITDALLIENCIIECTGLGLIGKRLKEALSQKFFIVLKIEEDLDICLERLKNKSFDDIPYPNYEESIRDSIIRIDNEIKCGKIEDGWLLQSIDILVIKNAFICSDILYKYEEICQLLSLILSLKKHENITFYGSLARDRFTKFSDVGIAVITSFNYQTYYDYIKEKYRYNFLDYFDEKICIYTDKQIIEIKILKKK